MTCVEQALRLDAGALSTVLAWQRAAGAHEVCGLYAVDELGGQRLLQLTNHAGLPEGFEISRTEEEVLRSAAAQRGWRIVAFVHTHPHHPAEMSPHDERSFERDNLPWIIVGNANTRPSQRAYTRLVAQVAAW